MTRRKRSKAPNVTGRPRRDCPDCRGSGWRKAAAFQHRGWDGQVRTIDNVSEPCPCAKTGGQGDLGLQTSVAPPPPEPIDQARRASGEREEA